MDLFTVFLFVVGFVALVGGAELLVRGAARLAALFGLSSLVIGLTVVAFGTSAPELAVGLQGVLAGEPDIALGNVVGSNIANILLILGIAAAITPLAVAAELVRWDIPLMIGASMVVYIMALDGEVSHFDGALLTLGILVYLILAIAYGRKPPGIDEVDTDDASSRGARAIAINGVLVVVGLVALVLGARLLVTAAVTVAQALGVSELVIGLTVIAIGTSLPEVATSVVAAAKGERDIAVGNAVGSNMFNLLAVLGITATVGGVAVDPAALVFDLPFMVAVAVACWPMAMNGGGIARWEGFVFLGFYALYLGYLVYDATATTLLVSPPVTAAIMGVALVGIALVSWRQRPMAP